VCKGSFVHGLEDGLITFKQDQLASSFVGHFVKGKRTCSGNYSVEKGILSRISSEIPETSSLLQLIQSKALILLNQDQLREDSLDSFLVVIRTTSGHTIGAFV
jgi:hypothetical protein